MNPWRCGRPQSYAATKDPFDNKVWSSMFLWEQPLVQLFCLMIVGTRFNLDEESFIRDPELQEALPASKHSMRAETRKSKASQAEPTNNTAGNLSPTNRTHPAPQPTQCSHMQNTQLAKVSSLNKHHKQQQSANTQTHKLKKHTHTPAIKHNQGILLLDKASQPASGCHLPHAATTLATFQS